MVRTRRGSRSRTATRAHGSEWSPSTRMLPMVRATATRAGKSSIRRNGCPTVMSACVSTPAARAARPVPSITSRRANRVDVGEESRAPPLDGDYRRERSPLWDKITVPFRSAANWGGQGLHLRGNFEGFVRAASKNKWLEAHGLEHWTHFYTDYGVKLQKRFFDHFLKGIDNGWTEQPRVQLQLRHVDRFVLRHEESQPLEPDEIVPLDIELWPTSIVVPSGHRLALTVRGRDYEWGKATGARLSNFKNELRGCGPFLHDDPRDRPTAVFGGTTTLHVGPSQQSYVLIPAIPPNG